MNNNISKNDFCIFFILYLTSSSVNRTLENINMAKDSLNTKNKHTQKRFRWFDFTAHCYAFFVSQSSGKRALGTANPKDVGKYTPVFSDGSKSPSLLIDCNNSNL